jgi:membrane-associated phospholipid phosphatase
LAQILTAKASAADTRFWPADKLILTYFAVMAVMIVGWWSQLPNAPRMLAWHIFGSALIIFEVKRPNPTSWIFRNWYPVLYVASCYREMASLIPVVRHSYAADGWLADFDLSLYGEQPAMWFGRHQVLALNEFLQVVYTLFIPAVLFVGVLLWRKGAIAEFQYYAFLIALGFLASYAGYVLVPARGPRFWLKELQYIPLQGSWLFHAMQAGLDGLEHAHYDCFPSGHTEMTILAWWGSRLVSKRLWTIYFAYTPPLIFATVYLRYHYSLDVFAGAILAILLIAATPSIYRALQREV